ncbi:hypothetical protein [Rubripirellula lacrimiformis]|nr:hypothetical protein [Rubripirellula lacrimiformis]
MTRGASRGLLVGATAALLVAFVRLAAVPTMHWGWPLAIVVAGGTLGWLVGMFRRHNEQSAARLVDQHYGLKDRSITSLQFDRERTAKADPVRQLQLAEADQQLRQVDPVQCVPISTPPQQLRWIGGLTAATALFLVLGSWMAPRVEAKSILPLAKQQSGDLRGTLLQELEQMADEQQDPEIEALVEELAQKLDKMESESLDEADLLATLSEMEQSLAEARESLQLEMTDTMLQALAAAMKPSDAMSQAAKALEAEDYDEASEKLKAIDPSQIGDKQRRAVADNLKKMLSKLKPAQQGQLSDSISELAEGLDSKNPSECKKCLSKLASACKKQGQCKKIGNCMSCQLNRLSQCKSECRGQCQSNSVAKSDSPSSKAGQGASGQPLGDQATKLDSVRNEEMLTGQQSEGPSETEILQAPEGEQQAVRQLTAKYNKFKREAEAVLDTEPLPMGHRETVRKYFEAIRPTHETESEMANDSAPTSL